MNTKRLRGRKQVQYFDEIEIRSLGAGRRNNLVRLAHFAEVSRLAAVAGFARLVLFAGFARLVLFAAVAFLSEVLSLFQNRQTRNFHVPALAVQVTQVLQPASLELRPAFACMILPALVLFPAGAGFALVRTLGLVDEKKALQFVEIQAVYLGDSAVLDVEAVLGEKPQPDSSVNSVAEIFLLCRSQFQNSRHVVDIVLYEHPSHFFGKLTPSFWLLFGFQLPPLPSLLQSSLVVGGRNHLGMSHEELLASVKSFVGGNRDLQGVRLAVVLLAVYHDPVLESKEFAWHLPVSGGHKFFLPPEVRGLGRALCENGVQNRLCTPGLADFFVPGEDHGCAEPRSRAFESVLRVLFPAGFFGHPFVSSPFL